MDARRRERLSKLLSLVLRHRPEVAGVELDARGFVPIDELLAGIVSAGEPLTRAELDEVVRGTDKQRFALCEAGTHIRALQGHSVSVELDLAPSLPPETLYHGTVARALPGIRARGLHRQRRHHVHLSATRDEALRVGGRRGAPVVLEIDSAAMAAGGALFLHTPNGVWLTERVPPGFIRFPVE